MNEQVVKGPGTENEVKVTAKGEGVKATSRVFSASPQGKTSTSEVFTSQIFEEALDRASRPVIGKYAHVPYSSEDLIRDKRQEVELEDR